MKKKRGALMPIKKEKNGTYRVDISLGFDKLTGKRVRTTRRGYSTLKEAKQAQAELISQHGKTAFTSNSTLQFKEYINEIFLPWYKTQTKESTYENRLHLVNKHFEFFSKLQLKQISPIMVQKWQSNLVKRYSNEYVRLLHAILTVSFNRAFRLGLVSVNPAKIAGNVKKQKKEVEFWTKEEFAKVISTIYVQDFYQHFLFTTLWLLFMTGMRIGEASGLQWQDIDLESKIIKVTKTLHYKNANDFQLTTPKTKASRREIAIDEETARVLHSWKEAQDKQILTKFVLSYNGIPTQKSTIAYAISRYAKLAGVKRIKIHALRHSHAAMLVNMGENPLIIKQRLGHEDIQTTLGTYGHLYPNSNVEVAEKLNGRVELKLAQSDQTTNTKNQFTSQTGVKLEST